MLPSDADNPSETQSHTETAVLLHPRGRCVILVPLSLPGVIASASWRYVCHSTYRVTPRIFFYTGQAGGRDVYGRCVVRAVCGVSRQGFVRFWTRRGLLDFQANGGLLYFEGRVSEICG